MSYSFQVRGETKDEIVNAASAEFDRIVQSQDMHAKDRDPALAVLGAYLDILKPIENHIYSASVHGSLGWLTAAQEICTASVGVTVSMIPSSTK